MKNKKIVCGTILLLFVISGLCSVIDVSADSWNDVNIPPSSYIYVNPYTLEYKDELILSITSSGIINVYIMNADQFSTLLSSGGLIWEYCIRWKDMTYLKHTFLVQEDDGYYVVLYNKAILSDRTVDIQITIDYYYEPYNDHINWNLINNMIFIAIPSVLIGIVIIVVVVFIKKHKRKTPTKPIIQIKEVPKITYCPECGIKITDMTKDYCSQCGSKIIN